ncbi:hypothetical protein AB4K05_07530 [Kluyvera sp. STS39-E]|uniref:hypothetical protein n=1 Tax=Kluyvera sp. STS39-E TaxID=3234748 RepID=UPI0034C5D7BC
MKKYHVFIFILMALLLVFLAGGYWHSQHNLSFTCSSSTVSLSTNTENKPFLNFTESVTFTLKGQVFVNISGEIHNEDASYTLNRSIIYDYIRLGSGDYQLHAIRVTPTGTDDIPAELAQKFLGQLSLDSYRVVSIRQLPSGDMVISNTTGPYIICAVH